MIKNLLFGALIPAVLVATGIGVLIGLKRPEPAKEPPVPDNRTALLGEMLSADVQRVRALSEMSDTLDIPVSGTVVPYREIELASEAAGRIIEKNPSTRSGNFVRKGTVLYRIDPRDYDLELERLNRKLEQERASLNELDQDVVNAGLMLEVADEELALAEADVKRFESLKDNFRSEAELDQARRSRLVSMNQRVSIRNQINLLEARRSRLQLAVKLVQTELEQAQLNLERTVVRAPVDGRVVSEQIEEDSYVQRGTPLVVIEDTEKVEVACNLRMDQLYWILDQQDLSADQLVNAAQASRYDLPQVPVKIRFELSGRESLLYEWDGRLDRYDGAGLDPQSRTVPVRAVVDHPGEFRINGKPASESKLSGPSSLVRGMFVEVLIQAKPSTPLLLVPKLAVKPATTANQIWKFRPDDQALERTRETLLAANNLATEGQATVENKVSRKITVKDPNAWQEGFVSVLEGVQVIGPYQGASSQAALDAEGPLAGDIEYWICEVPDNSLSVGDAVVVTPLQGIEAEGEEVIRVRKSQLEAGYMTASH
jgi:multidrug efflux pump subunit AcrA (membrane-fusion protein)